MNEVNSEVAVVVRQQKTRRDTHLIISANVTGGI